MMEQNQSIQTIIKQRFSCRTYENKPIAPQARQQLEALIAQATVGPLGSKARFALIAAAETDRQALKGLGTYGFIKNPAGFIVGAVGQAANDMEDFGYLMEKLILNATALGLGTCWLGGTFARSRFARVIDLQAGESLPAVASLGYGASQPRARDVLIRRGAESNKRLPWEQLFFDGAFGTPLGREGAGKYAGPLEMVRLGPSASNKQPWRIVRQGGRWHFYLQRTPGYGKSVLGLAKMADLQRVDVGIALCHWALTAVALALPGAWQVSKPEIGRPDTLTEYAVTWAGV
ncbi:MAG: nitroreductase family protein [Anaerolineae bacterium]|nr:nitroreductase family protein [Anaerolineae bacterium]